MAASECSLPRLCPGGSLVDGLIGLCWVFGGPGSRLLLSVVRRFRKLLSGRLDLDLELDLEFGTWLFCCHRFDYWRDVRRYARCGPHESE